MSKKSLKTKIKEIRKSLELQLRGKGADVSHFRGQVEDYLFMFEMTENMKRDIQERGTTYMAVSAAGKPYEKENPSVKNLLVYNKQMLAILKALDLQAENIEDDTEDDL